MSKLKYQKSVVQLTVEYLQQTLNANESAASQHYVLLENSKNHFLMPIFPSFSYCFFFKKK